MLYLEVFENSSDLSLSEITKKISSRDVFSYTFLKLNFFHLERLGKKAGLRPSASLFTLGHQLHL